MYLCRSEILNWLVQRKKIERSGCNESISTYMCACVCVYVYGASEKVETDRLFNFFFVESENNVDDVL